MTTIAWPFKADWGDTILETLDWLTAIQTSRTGAEQRQALRQNPRRTVEFPVQLYGHERSYFDMMLMQHGGQPWFVPLPHEQFAIADVLHAGDTFVPHDTSYSAYGSKIIIQDFRSIRAEVCEVTSVVAGGVHCSPLQYDYVNGVIAGPAILAQLTDDVTMSRKSAAVFAGSVRFTNLEPQYNIPSAPGLPVYLTFPLLLVPPNSIDDLDYIYHRNMSKIDNQTGPQRFIDQSARAFQMQKHAFFLHGRKERSNFRDILYLLRGQLNAVWLPSFNDDLAPNQGWLDPTGVLATVPGREHAIQFMRDGSYTIINPTSGGSEKRPLYDSGSIVQTCFLSLKRLGADTVEFNHHSGIDGVSTVSLLFRDAPDLRVDSKGYYKNPFVTTGDPSPALAQPTLDMVTPITVSGAAGGS